jgi:integrase
MVRQFAQHRSATDPRTEIPPQGLLPHRYRRRAPYIYRDEEIQTLIDAAKELPSSSGLRAWTFSTLFGLIAVTGMRMGEPIALNREDVDLSRGDLFIRGAKFGKSRLVPLHPSTQEVLQEYVRRRAAINPRPKTPSFFLCERGNRLTDGMVRWTFVKISHQIGLRGPGDRRGPRLQDLRHTFAVKTIMRWYRAGLDVEQHLPELSTYLGHAHVADTYWYLSATPELLQLVANRCSAPEGGSL